MLIIPFISMHDNSKKKKNTRLKINNNLLLPTLMSLGIFSVVPLIEPCALRSTHTLKVPGISTGVKAAGAFGWWPTTFVVPKRQDNPGP